MTAFILSPGSLIVLGTLVALGFVLWMELRAHRTEDTDDGFEDDEMVPGFLLRVFDESTEGDAGCPDMKSVLAVRVGMTTTGGMAAEVRRHKGYCPGLLAAALHATAHYLEATHGQND